jgi:hypothetical protein
MKNQRREATDQSFSFNLNAMSIMSFCRAIDSGNSATSEPDMFSRWIKLSDDSLAANWKPRKRVASRSRGKFQAVFSAIPA